MNVFEADSLEGFGAFVENRDEKEFLGRFLLQGPKSGIKSFVGDLAQSVEEFAGLVGGGGGFGGVAGGSPVAQLQ